MGSSNSSYYSNYSSDYINDSVNSISTYVNSSSSDSYKSNNNSNTNYSETLSSEEVDNDCINVLLESGLNRRIKGKCCLKRNQSYDLFATINKNRSNYNYYMKACCYVNLTEDFNYLNYKKEKGLFPFDIGMIDIVKLNSNKEVYDFKKNNFRVFKVQCNNSEVEVKFAKIPYIGVLIL